MKLWELMQEVLRRAVLAVGVLSTLLTLAAAGLLLAWRFGDVAWLLLALFGALGSAEVLHRQQQAHLVQRRQVLGCDVFLAMARKHPHWQPKVLKKFEHGGLLFHVVGFEQLEVPLAVTSPLCPRCTGHLAERRETLRPGRVRIEHRCSCGFAQRSAHTLGELQHEAHQMAGCPN